MTESPPPTPLPSEEYAKTIKTLRNLNSMFYGMCFSAGVGSSAHAFIEFNGLMSKYIDLLERAVKEGHDPQHVNAHVGVPLPVEQHDMEYLAEKLNCLFGPVLESNPKMKRVLRIALNL